MYTYNFNLINKLSKAKSAGVEPANGSIKTSCLNLLATTYNSKISPAWPSAYEYWISSSLVKNFDLGKVSQGSPPQGGTKGITLLFTCVHYLVSSPSGDRGGQLPRGK